MILVKFMTSLTLIKITKGWLYERGAFAEWQKNIENFHPLSKIFYGNENSYFACSLHFLVIKKQQNVSEIEKKSEIYKSFVTKEKVEFQGLSFIQMFEKYLPVKELILGKLQLYLKNGFHHKTLGNTFSFPYKALSQLNRMKFQYNQSTGVFCCHILCIE